MPARDAADPQRPRPRPTPTHAVSTPTRAAASWAASPRRRGARLTGLRGSTSTGPPGRIEAQPAQVMAAAGNAVVTAARVGRLLGRSYWRIAKQLPGVGVVEAQAQRLRQAAAGEFARLLEMPQQFTGGGAGSEEQRIMMLMASAGSDPGPLRSAMTELLQRSTDADSGQTREYLFGSIVSQLVPDEARVLAALAGGRAFAAVDVVNKPNGRSGRNQTVLANTSTLGTAAGISVPAGIGTYLSRLQGFGLIDFAHDPTHLDPQFESLLRDAGVAAARAGIEAGRQGNAKIVRKAVTLSPLGQEFWAACAPSTNRLARRHN